MGYQGKMHKSRSNFKGGYHRGSFPTMNEPDNRFYRRHGRYLELEFRSTARKVERKRRLHENPRLVSFHFLHHNL